jgi:hypothetical protein
MAAPTGSTVNFTKTVVVTYLFNSNRRARALTVRVC